MFSGCATLLDLKAGVIAHKQAILCAPFCDMVGGWYRLSKQGRVRMRKAGSIMECWHVVEWDMVEVEVWPRITEVQSLAKRTGIESIF